MSLENRLGGWYNHLIDEFKQPYMKRLSSIIRAERSKYTIYPKQEDVFKAYRYTSPTDLKVLIIGQDPYPHKSANGLAFSSYKENPIPPSLRNIFKEINDDIGYQEYHNPELDRWAKQGVMLLNTSLTVREGQPASHSNIGWEKFTRKTIEIINNKEDPVVFILWGRHAQRIASNVSDRHFKIESPHPSPLSASRGFFGSKPFSRTNKILKDNYNIEISWNEHS